MLHFYIYFLLFSSIQSFTSKSNYYSILGVSKHATIADIKSAYKRLAMIMHPDKSEDPDANAKFILLSQAYHTLKDPKTRMHYDRYGSSGYTGSHGQKRKSQQKQSKTTFNRDQRYKGRTNKEEMRVLYNSKYKNIKLHSVYSLLKTMESNEVWFIHFYESDKCDYCDQFAPIFNTVGDNLFGIAKTGAFLCDDYEDFCNKLLEIPTRAGPRIVFLKPYHWSQNDYRTIEYDDEGVTLKIKIRKFDPPIHIQKNKQIFYNLIIDHNFDKIENLKGRGLD